MKYVVDIAGQSVEVEVDGDRVQVDGAPVAASVTELPNTPIVLVKLGDTIHRVAVARGPGRGRYGLSLDGWLYDVEALNERARAIRQLSATSVGAKGPAPLVAPMPGLIVRVNVAVGASVQQGQGLVVMEAMKMENELRATSAGTVKAVRVSPGTAVERGAILLELD